MRPNYLKFAAHCSVLGALVGVLFTVAIQFLQDSRDMSLATAWDLFTHLPPWEWVEPSQWVLMIVGGGVLAPLFMTTAFWFAESPRWNK